MKTFSLILIAILSLLFWKSFVPSQVVFSNDGPLGSQVAEQVKTPGLFVSVWQDLNWLGNEAPPVSIGPSGGFRTICYYFSVMLRVMCIALCIYFMKPRRISSKHLVGYSCFLFAGIITICMIVGLEYEVAQALMSLGCLVFVFAVIFTISGTERSDGQIESVSSATNNN